MQNSIIVECKETVKINDGIHRGKIIDISPRITKEGWKYLDFTIEIEDVSETEKPKIRYSTSDKVREGSKLGALISNFEPLEVNKKYDLVTLFVARVVTFITMQKKGKDNKSYAEIVEGSIKPLVVGVK
jgi:hypothetical protein